MIKKRNASKSSKRRMSHALTCDDGGRREYDHKLIEDVCALHTTGTLKALAVLDSRRRAEKAVTNLLAVWENYPDGVKACRIDEGNDGFFVLCVSKDFFEGDVKEAFLGQLVASWLLADYRGLLGGEYLHRNEVLFKKEKVVEAVTGLALEYGDLSTEIMIDPKYFVLESVRRMTRVYPPLSSIYEGFLMGEAESTSTMLRGYQEAIGELVKEGTIHFGNGYLLMDESFAEKTGKQRFKAISFLKMIERTLGPYLLQRLKRAGTLLNLYLEMTRYYGMGPLEADRGIVTEDPRSFLHLPTTLGTVSLGTELGIEDILTYVQPLGDITSLELERCGGVLNDVYILRFRRGEKEEKALVKKFQNWVGLKWFPLALWTLGTQNFSVLGRTRLGREYSIGNKLRRNGVPVPANYHVDINRMVLIREFIEGQSHMSVVKSFLSQGRSEVEFEKLRRLGGLVARIHELGITVGDCKPENFIEDPSGTVHVIDLEQGAYKGNRAWDLAELLYYSGHYASIFTDSERISDLTEAIVSGYLENRGDINVVNEVGGIRYTKVFSLFTLPQFIHTISKTCREEGRS